MKLFLIQKRHCGYKRGFVSTAQLFERNMFRGANNAQLMWELLRMLRRQGRWRDQCLPPQWWLQPDSCYKMYDVYIYIRTFVHMDVIGSGV